MKEGGNMERVQMTIRLPTEIMDKLRQQAGEMGISINDVVIMHLRRSIQQE